MNSTHTEPVVRLRGICKSFPGVTANDHVDLDVFAGEIRALLGENGAGKSTLMNVLAGLYRPDDGEIFRKGHLVDFRSPRDAIDNGIGMVHQHFTLVESLTVAENVLLGLQSKGLIMQIAEARQRIREFSTRYRLKVDPDAFVWQLSVGEQQRVEILKLLYRGAEVLILDEPTAVLTPQESAELARMLRSMATEGKAIVFITHKLDEVLTFSDCVTVLRQGQVVASMDVRDASKEALARLMVGREVLFRLSRQACQPGANALEVTHLVALNDKGLPALRDVSFAICAGEVLGVAGVAGNGQRELAEVITGLRRSVGGDVSVSGKNITNCPPRVAIDAGISHIPGDRLGVGLVPNLPVSDSLAMKAYRAPPLSRGPILDRPSLRRFAERLIAAFRIATPSADTVTRLLSGGNQQRIVLAREISADKGIIIAVHPTRGLDVGATEAIRRALLDQRDNGAAILLISEDLDELLDLSDRIAVLFDGSIMGTVSSGHTTAEQLGLMMGGQPLSVKRDGELRAQ
jgi:ABC-type uncharacterized transport system ATPase subunit